MTTTAPLHELIGQRKALLDEALDILDHVPWWRRWLRLPPPERLSVRNRRRLDDIHTDVRLVDDRIAARLEARRLHDEVSAEVDGNLSVTVEADPTPPAIRARHTNMLPPTIRHAMVPPGVALLMPRAALQEAEEAARAAALEQAIHGTVSYEVDE